MASGWIRVTYSDRIVHIVPYRSIRTLIASCTRFRAKCLTSLLTPWLPKSCHFTVHGFLPLCLSPLCYYGSTFQPNSIYKSKHAHTRFAIRQLAVSSPPCIPYARHPVCYTRYVTLCLTTLPPIRDRALSHSPSTYQSAHHPVSHMPAMYHSTTVCSPALYPANALMFTHLLTTH